MNEKQSGELVSKIDQLLRKHHDLSLTLNQLVALMGNVVRLENYYTYNLTAKLNDTRQPCNLAVYFTPEVIEIKITAVNTDAGYCAYRIKHI